MSANRREKTFLPGEALEALTALQWQPHGGYNRPSSSSFRGFIDHAMCKALRQSSRRLPALDRFSAGYDPSLAPKMEFLVRGTQSGFLPSDKLHGQPHRLRSKL
jgi:hypothetical protein